MTLAVGATVAVVLLVVWAQGWFALLAYHAVDLQRDLQNALAGAIRQLKAGNAGALIGFVGLCFGYGVVHAIGPGHGKGYWGPMLWATVSRRGGSSQWRLRQALHRRPLRLCWSMRGCCCSRGRANR